VTIPGSTSLEFKGIRIQVRTELALDAVVARLRSVTKSGTVADIIRLARAAPDEAAFASEVRKQYIGPSGFMTFATIDHGSWLSRYGIERQVLRWILGNPLIAITMMKNDITAGLFAPVELLMAENLDGNGTTITFVRPSTLIATSRDAATLDSALALDEKFEALVAYIAGIDELGATDGGEPTSPDL
jgi:uncharacterized protein (DUF302 family)